MAPAHRLAVELSDQTGGVPQLEQTSQVESEKRDLNHRITAKRFSATAFIARRGEKGKKNQWLAVAYRLGPEFPAQCGTRHEAQPNRVVAKAKPLRFVHDWGYKPNPKKFRRRPNNRPQERRRSTFPKTMLGEQRQAGTEALLGHELRLFTFPKRPLVGKIPTFSILGKFFGV
jgi:hypothetical protein